MEEVIIAEIILMEIRELLHRNAVNRAQRTIMRNMRDELDPFAVSEAVFIKNFRMPKCLALKLIEMIEPHDNLIHSTIPFHFKVLATLNFFATGSYQNPVGRNNILNLSQPSISRIIGYIGMLIVKNLRAFIRFPETSSEMEEIRNGFIADFGFYHTLGCIDCTHIAIIAPPECDELHPPRVYRNRKRFYSLNVEAICDSKLLFLAVNARFPGSCHDSGIWTTSDVRRHMKKLNRQSEVWLLGDSGYPLEPWLLTPYLEPAENWQEAFNKDHIKSRNTIERAFGVLKSTFRCLLKHRTLHYHPSKAGLIINSCFILHNFLNREGFLHTTDADDADDYERQSSENHCHPQTDLHRRGTIVRDSYARWKYS